MKLLELGLRNLKELRRDRMALGFLLGFPVAFMVMMGLAFGSMGPSPIPIGLIDQDQTPASAAFSQVLSQIPALKVTPYPDLSQAQHQVRLGEEVGFIVLPRGFGEKATSHRQGGGEKIPLQISFDQTDPQVGPRLLSIVSTAAQSFVGQESPLELELGSIQREVKSPFLNWMASGVIVFGLMILISTTARMMVQDRETGFLFRLLATPIRPWDLLLGYALPLSLISLITVPLYLTVAWLMGVKFFGSLPLAFLFFFTTAVLCVGLGLVISSLVKTAQQADGLAWLIIIPVTMISGVWWPTEGMPWYMRDLAQALPFSHAAEGARNIINRAAGWEGVATDFFILLAWAVASFILGLILFRKLVVR